MAADARRTNRSSRVSLDVRTRLALLVFLPLAVVATGLAGLVYLVAQQDGRWLANEPQVQLAEDAAARLDAGGLPVDQVGREPMDIGRSLAPFVIVYGMTGTILATDGALDGLPPDVPPRASGRRRAAAVATRSPGSHARASASRRSASRGVAARSLRAGRCGRSRSTPPRSG